MAVAEGARRRQDLAGEGQRQLEEAVAAAFQILTSINHELCNPALWSSSSSSQQQEHQPTVPAAPDSHTSADAEGGGGGAGPGGSLDEARHRYKTAVSALRASITAVSSSSQEIRPLDNKTNKDEIGKLEERASVLRKEIETKNKNVKLLMNQLRDMILDVSMWQSPCPA